MAAAPDTFTLGGELEVQRLGFGAMRITGPGIWGEPDDQNAARELLRHVVEAGVNLIDTADSYGPEVSERLIAEALAPLSRGPRDRHQGRTRRAPARIAGSATAAPIGSSAAARSRCGG